MDANFHPEKGPYLRTLSPGDRFVGYYVLRNYQMESFRDPARGVFMSLILSDRSGKLAGRVWENAEEAAEGLSAKNVVKVEGEIETYLDRKQIRVLRIRNVREDEYDLRDMLPASENDPDEMLNLLDGHIESIQDIHLSALLNIFFSDPAFRNLFKQVPAAKVVHHAYLGGLIEHVLEILTLSETVSALYPQINSDLLRTGVILHDIGKIREFEWDFDIDYTDEGRLLGHIVITDEMLNQALQQLPDFPAQLALELRHILLAHHGKYEWGSPRRPKTLEAIALHHLENLDAQINRFHLLIDDAADDTNWTAYDRLLRRQLYTGGENDLSIEESGFIE